MGKYRQYRWPRPGEKCTNKHNTFDENAQLEAASSFSTLKKTPLIEQRNIDSKIRA